MPPKIVFNEEEVIKAAYELALEGGIGILSARKIADKLNSSTAPVYSTFHSMDILKQKVIEQVKNLILSYVKGSYTKSIFLNMGTGYALFARDYQQLYRSMFLDSISENMLEYFMEQLTEEMKKDDLLKHLPEEEQLSVMSRMIIFTQGYASFICVGYYENLSKQDIIQFMYEMGRDVIGHALYRHGKTEFIPEEKK